MKHFFVSSAGKLYQNWQEAFPQGRLYAAVDEVPRGGSQDEALVWLDPGRLALSSPAEDFECLSHLVAF